jgi:DNA polymerase elongation subunit (family B)
LNHFVVNSQESYNEFKAYILEDKPKFTINDNKVITDEYVVDVLPEYSILLKEISAKTTDYSPLIYGKDPTEKVISLEVEEDRLLIYTLDGKVLEKPLKLWIVSSKKLGSKWYPLQGKTHYKYIRYCSTQTEFKTTIENLRKDRKDFYTIHTATENQMIIHGITYFKGCTVDEIPRLGFDIEADGLQEHADSEIYTISNTFRNGSAEIKKTFRVDNYSNCGKMIQDWCKFVREHNPALLVAHNGFGYDLRYLKHVADLHGVSLELGVDGSEALFPDRSKKLRVDGSQEWEYKDCLIKGRSVIDTMQLAVKYDIGKNFPNWGLKSIIEHLGLVKEGRQFYDASKIRENWYDLTEREKIVEYCADDGDDCLNLYELMSPSFFYMCQTIPKPYQMMLQGASGGWLNAILIRGYLQEGKTIPKAERDNSGFGGGVSFGRPGIHKNVFKIDVASLYPSIMRNWKISDKKKDPDNMFFEMVDTFTVERLKNKKLHKETGDKYYDDLQGSQKVLINSCYGMLGTPGLAFNSFENAAFVTGLGRQIIRQTMIWATGKDLDYWWQGDREYDFNADKPYLGKLTLPSLHNFVIVNADTDSISFKKEDESEFTEEEKLSLIEEINSHLPELIKYEDDGYYETVIVVKAKNYVLKEAEKSKIKYKGSSLKDAKKEPILRKFLKEVIEEGLIFQKRDYVDIYEDYVRKALTIIDIEPWCTKKSITEKLMTSERTNETKVIDALKGVDFRVGDKVFVFSDIEGEVQEVKKGEPVFLKNGQPKMIPNCVLKVKENFTGTYDKWHYVGRVYNTIKILENIIDMNKIIKYHLKANNKLADSLLEE